MRAEEPETTKRNYKDEVAVGRDQGDLRYEKTKRN
jgi:hypothetical protein